MKIITFEDHGQDFHIWQVDSAGMVVSSQPFQGWLWGGGFVINHETIKAGDRVAWVKDRRKPHSVINYPVASVTERPSRFAIERAPTRGAHSQLKRYLTKGCGWTVYFDKAAIFDTRAEAEKRNGNHNDKIIEL
jgi:plastocyanin